jgi:hypothetical protein
MTEPSMDCRDICAILLRSAVSADQEGHWPARVAAHLQGCEDCRLYAEGLRLAPQLFSGASLYHPELRQRSLAAVGGAAGSRDLKLGLLLAPPVFVFLLLSFLIPAYFCEQLLSSLFDSTLMAWFISLAAVWTFGGTAGGICLAMLLRRHVQGNRFTEASYG